MAMNVSVVAATGILWEGEATSVVVPALNGSLGVLPGHQPLLAALVAGTTKIITEAGETVSLDGPPGFFSVDNDVVIIVIDDSGAAASIAVEEA